MSRPPAAGTTPPGAASEKDAARWVREMFGRVAGTYDSLNHLLSFNLDRYWRAHTVRRLRHVLDRPGSRILDVCCGTGDLLLGIQKRNRGPVMGGDFCHPMLVVAREKIRRRGFEPALMEADAMALPLRDGSLDLITTAFGFRNLANYERGLAEMRRVLRPSGVAAILEFSQPLNSPLGAMYRFYFRRLLPAIGRVVSGDSSAYQYLPESVSKFPGPAELAEAMRRAGFREVRYEKLTGGIVTLHTGVAG